MENREWALLLKLTQLSLMWECGSAIPGAVAAQGCDPGKVFKVWMQPPLAAGIKCEQLLVQLPGAGGALQECKGVASCGLLESSRNLPLLPCQIFLGNLYSSWENTLQFSAGIFEAGRGIQAK